MTALDRHAGIAYEGDAPVSVWIGTLASVERWARTEQSEGRTIVMRPASLDENLGTLTQDTWPPDPNVTVSHLGTFYL